mgnify:CR=1 FL=1
MESNFEIKSGQEINTKIYILKAKEIYEANIYIFNNYIFYVKFMHNQYWKKTNIIKRKTGSTENGRY